MAIVLQGINYAAHLARFSLEVKSYFDRRDLEDDTFASKVGKADSALEGAKLVLQCAGTFLPQEIQPAAKSIEAAVRLSRAFTLPSQVANGRSIDLVRREILAELLGSMRNALEVDAIKYRNYTELSAEELGRVRIQKPIYEKTGVIDDLYEGRRLVGYETVGVTLEECQQRFEENATGAAVANYPELVLRAMSLFDSPAPLPALAAPAAARVAAGAAAPGPDSMFDLLGFQEIPLELHDDVVLKNYEDPITISPIRFVVRNSAHPNILYEKASIENLIRRGGGQAVCPKSRDPISLASLEPAPEIQAIINRRLETLTARLNECRQAVIAQVAAVSA